MIQVMEVNIIKFKVNIINLPIEEGRQARAFRWGFRPHPQYGLVKDCL